MWHASVSFLLPYSADKFREALEQALTGVGTDKEWLEEGNRGVVHLRRLMTDEEMQIAGTPRDIRGTKDAEYRIGRVAKAMGWSISATKRMEGLADEPSP